MSAVVAALSAVEGGRDLDAAQVERAFGAMLDGEAAPEEAAALLTALAKKGETALELAAAVRAIRARATRFDCAGPLLDTCGTGGDKLGTFNVSTAAAFVAAAAGVRVAKHGNRAVSGTVGTADVLEAAGAQIEMAPPVATRSLAEVGFCFLFAPYYHPAMKRVAAVRRSLEFPTVFNLAGPLCNPAGASRQVIGVFSADRVDVVAGALAALGTEHALVVHGKEGADEITPTGATSVREIRGRQITGWEIEPRSLGVAPCTLQDLRGGDARENASILRDVLSGSRGPRSDTVALNAAASLYVAGRCSTVEDAVRRARAILATGEACRRLERFVEISRGA